jgi:hypothetical protein
VSRHVGVSDKTQREIAAMLDRFEPPALVEIADDDFRHVEGSL